MAELNHRERLLRTLRFQPVDRAPDMEFFAWQQTIERWKNEGLEAEKFDFNTYFGLDEAEWGPRPWFNFGLQPAFQHKVLEDTGEHLIVQDSDGATSEQAKVGASIPRYIKFAIETRKDWEKMAAERLNPDSPERIPDNLDDFAERCGPNRTKPMILFPGSLYGWIRNWMGVENLSLALYDDYAWVEEMMQHLTRLTLAILDKISGKVQADMTIWWEDMAYRGGSLMSPKMFESLMVPRYKRITDRLREDFGCEFNLVDCDGNVHELVGLWLDGGINVMFPVEVAHSDAYRISEEFGTRCPMRGGYDKRALIEGPAAIDAEFERIRPLYEKGGFIPHTDHLVPPDVSFENYLHYRRRKCEFLGKEWVDPREQG